MAGRCNVGHMYADSAEWQYSAKAGCEYAGYSNELASSPSSTAVAVPLLPHGRRLGKVQPCSELLTKESSEQCTQKPSFPERGRTALAVGDSRQVRVIGRGSATKQSPLSLKEGGPLAVGDSRRVRVIGRVVQRRVFVCRFSRLAVQCQGWERACKVLL